MTHKLQRLLVLTEVPEIWRGCDGYMFAADASEVEVTRTDALTMPVSKGVIKPVATGEKEIAKHFTKEQEAFLAAVGGQTIEYDAWCSRGSVEGHRWTFDDPACPWRLTVES